MNERPFDDHCARCLRPTPPDDDPSESDWVPWTPPDSEALLVICPDCITPEEQQAMADDLMKMADEIDPGWGAEEDS